MTLAEYIRSLPAARVERAADDLGEAARIEAEHAALPGAIFDTPEAAEGAAPGGIGGEVRPELSFDLSDDASVKTFISGMEVSHPELVNRLRRDERAWDEMVALDRGHMTRLQRDGGVKFSGDDNADYDFYRWAYGRGMLASDASLGGLASAFGRGFLQIVKGAAKLTGAAAKSVMNPTAGVELAATAVDAAQAAVAEYQQLGAGLAALTSGDDPQVRMAAMYELAKFSDEEQRTHNAWRKAISDSFAEVPVDEDSVEFLSETFDVSNLIGAGAGKLVTRGLKRVGASGAAELLGRSRTAFGSEMLASTLSKVPLVGAPYKRAILVGQADLLSTEAQVAYEAVARAQADLAAKRATLAASPASDPKDVLLRKVAEAETDVARRSAEFNAAKSKLDSVRRNVTDTLDLEGRGLLNIAAAGTVEGAGTLIRGTGRTMTRAYRGLSELLTGEADNAAFDLAAGQVAGNLANKGNIITRLGQDVVAAGRTMAQNGATIPYFRRLRQAEDATKLTRGAAAFIDWSHLGWAADKLGDTLKAGAAGAPVSGVFGYVASGGDVAAAVESAGAGAAYGIGGGAYGQWEAYKDPRFRYEELLSNRREFRDTLSAREVGGVSQLQIFDQLDAGDQLAIASYAQGKPDVAFRFINDRNQASGYYDRDNNVVVINRASKTPVADIFRHEVAHFVERHGLQSQVRELYLGDAEKGVVGQFTALDPLGNPVFVESTDPDGTTRYRYQLNAAGEKLKAEYTAKIRAVDPTFSMSDEYLASELFAEQYADYLFGGGLRRDLGRNAFDNVVEAMAGKPVVKNFLGAIGLLFDSDDNVVGTGVFRELKGNEGVRRLISQFTTDVAKGRKPAIEDSVEQHVFTETELRDPELATKWLQGGGAVRFGPDGRPAYDAKGVPQFLTEKEADAQQRDLANELIAAIEKHVAENPADADVLQRREIIDVNGVKRTLFSGRRIPASVIDALEAQKRFNPHQLAHLRAASASVEKNGTGAMIAHFYQAASRKLGGKAYKTVGGRWRRDGVVGFQITKDGNVVINSVSWEQLAENARRAAGQKLAREIYATSGIPVDAAIIADVKTYLGNVIDGRPGATGIGETRRDFINNLFGIRMASNEDVNPFFASIAAPKTILTNLRLDRINRLAPLDHVEVPWGPQHYRRVKANMRPETSSPETAGDSSREEARGKPMSFRPDEMGFFSQLERTLQAIPTKATPEQVRAALREGVKEKGQLKERPVKREEMEDVKDVTGRSFAAWLDENPDATRGQMLDFARENRVRLSTTTLDGDARFYIARDGMVDLRNLFRTSREAYNEISRRQEQMRDRYTITGDGMWDESGEKVYVIAEEPDGTFGIRDSSGQLVDRGNASRGDARQFLEREMETIMERDGERYEVGEDENVASRYAEYTLEGGRSYREHILTIPTAGDGYQSPHFVEKGYLAHVRTTERETSDGKKVYFAEEIQSDLHQAGRKQGYRERDPERERRELSLKEVYEKALDESEQAYKALVQTGPRGQGYEALRRDYFRLEQEADNARAEWLQVSRDSAAGMVPDAPFKNSWHELGFKYLLGEAVRSGAEYMGWTTGRQQNDRYSLSSRVNALSYVKLEDGKYLLEAMPKGRDRDWIPVGRFEEAKLAAAVGKEISGRIIKGEGEPIRHTNRTLLNGLDLEVGGEGMRGFYDRIIPQFADRYLKRYGIQTEDIQLSTGEGVHAVEITPELRSDIAERGQPQYRPDEAEPKQPARNENAFTRSLEHIKEAIPPTERFVGRFEPGKPILRPSGRDWHSGDSEAPVGDLGFSQRVIDDAFQAAVSESGPAAQKAVDALAEAGDQMIPPSGLHWAEAGRNLKLVDRLWYEYSSEAMRKAFPSEDPKSRLIQVADQIAATSPLADPNYNAELAISILSEMERGSPIFTPAVNMSGVSDAALGKFGAGESRKVGSFSETFKFLGGAHDEPPLTTNDRQVAASFGIPDAAFGKYPVLYEVVSRFYNHLRDDYNSRHGLVEGSWHGDDNGPMQSHQLQAISWVQTRAETRMENRKAITEEEAFNGDAYHQAFKLAATTLRDGGVNVPVDENGDPRFTREVLQDSRVTSILAPTTDDFRHSLMLTQEIGTNLTDVGREFGELVAKSKELGITKNLEEAEKITNRYLNALGQRTKVEGKAKKEPSVMGKLVSAFAGKGVDVSRIEKGWGSFEGEFSKNLRVPIDDVPEQYREAFISVIGRQLKQAAGAASKFVSTDSAQPTSGATRTYTVFLPGVLEPTADVSLLAKHLSSNGHEVNVSERPNGLVIDINPSFSADGPKGIEFQMLQSLVLETFGDAARIYAADHSSYFVESSEYGAKISHARKQLLDDAARSISQFFPSRRAAKDFLRSEAPSAGEIAQAGDARRAEAVRARYAESIRLLESAEKDLAKVARDYERDMIVAGEVLKKRIFRKEEATTVSKKALEPPS